jgi:hypothetical protein
MVTIIYVISVLLALVLLVKAAKNDFGYVTIGGMIPLVVLSTLPVVNVLGGVVLYLLSDDKNGNWLDKKIF